MNPEHLASIVNSLGIASDEAPKRAPRAWICSGCGGAAVSGYAFCDPCQREAINRKRADMVAKARATLPSGALPAGFKTDLLRARVCRESYLGAVKSAWTWLKLPTDTLLVLGGAGKGKTSLAAAVALAILDAGSSADASDAAYQRARGVLWADATELAQARRNHPLGHGEAPLIRKAIDASVLFVDELGAEKSDPVSGTDPVRDVIWSRFEGGKPTVFSSAFSRATLAARYGGGGERRLFEAPRATVIDLGGSS